ncbi:hypothetical protein B0H65DRAFT_453614 [Neurospora tetraspora]|uniref:Secreted protein n=1 Tax=Neurospora tetraspora TaxID=94610 RepID=A0AAE0JR81_9PEZI|nr:hypothetical protein B0H65DRAFT_453614 [Neurospora tetraspora]
MNILQSCNVVWCCFLISCHVMSCHVGGGDRCREYMYWAPPPILHSVGSLPRYRRWGRWGRWVRWVGGWVNRVLGGIPVAFLGG